MFYLQDCKEAVMAVEWLLLGRYEQMYIYPQYHRDQRNKSWWESLNNVQVTQNSCKTNVIAVASHDWGLLYIPGNPWMTDRQLDSCELLISGDCSLVFKTRESVSWILKISELKFQLASWESACGKMGSIAVLQWAPWVMWTLVTSSSLWSIPTLRECLNSEEMTM